MLKNYIWDFDGTLYDTYPTMVIAVAETLKEFGAFMSPDQIYRTMKQESLHFLRERFGFDKISFDNLFHQYENQNLTQSNPFIDTETTLKGIVQKGGQHFILTHRKVASTESLLKRDGLTSLITDIVGLDSGFARKPRLDSLFYLIDKYQLNEDETLMIGDRKLDVEAGSNAGVKTCLYDIDGFLGEIAADFRVNRLAKILQFSN